MGNAESSRRGEEKSREGEKDSKERAVQSAAAAVTVAATAATVAYGAWRLFSSSQAQEEEPSTMGTREIHGRGSLTGVRSLEGVGKTTGASQAAWSAPPSGWYKLNTDYSGKRQPHQGPPKLLGIGGLIRDPSGEMLCCFADRVLEAASIEEGEAFALLRGLEMAREEGCKKLIVESDHNSIVQVLKGKGKLRNPKLGNGDYNFYMDSIIRALDDDDGWFEASQVHHVIGGKANKCADRLAQVGAERGQCSMDDLQIFPDSRLQVLLREDKKMLR